MAGVTAVVTSAAGPGTLKVTSALRPLAETSAWPPGCSGERIPAAAPGSRDNEAVTWLTAWRIAGSVANVCPGPRSWISTASVVGAVTPRCCRVCSACPAWCWVLGLAVLVFRGNRAKDAELLVLRHENAVLRRHAGRVRYESADWAWLAALARLVPRRRWAESSP